MGATNTLYFCSQSQNMVDTLLSAGSNPVNQVKDTLGTLAALNSTTNLQGWSALPVQDGAWARPSSTSNRKVSIAGRVRACPTVVTTEISACTGVTPETTDLVDTEVQIGNYRGIQETIDLALYRDTCDGSSDSVIAYKLIEMATEILKQEDIDAVTALQAAVGDYFSGNDSAIGGGTEVTVPLYASTVPRTPQPGNLFLILEEYRRKGYNTGTAPIIIGGTGFARFAYDSNFFAGDTAATGRDITKIPGGLNPYIDYQVDSIAATGANHAISFQPGHAQMLYFRDFAEGSPLRRGEEIITKTTINIGGEVFDYQVYNNPCDDYVDITLSRWSEPYVLPEATFFSATCGAEFSLLNWRLGCADTTCDNIFIPGNIIT